MFTLRKKKERVLGFLEKYPSQSMVAFFLIGFVIDNLTLTRIDQTFDNLVLLSYLLISLFGIILYIWREHKRIKSKSLRYLSRYSIFIIQFAFGGLFSGFVIFYTKASSFVTAWPFLLLIYVLFLGNEKFKNAYQSLSFIFSLWFLGLFSFLIFYFPIVTLSLDEWVFIASGVASISVMFFILKVIAKTFESISFKEFSKIYTSVLLVFIFINTLYFFNLIPPIPLSAKDVGVYHFVGRNEDGKYEIEKENWSGLKFYRNYLNDIYVKERERVYFYTAVFAPTDLKTDIVHSWEYYNQTNKRWEQVQKISYPIVGGREDGYKGYSYLSKPKEGEYRVNVENKRGQVVKRYNFDVIFTEIEITKIVEVLR